MSTQPIRLTKGRAEALLYIVSVGLDNERDSIETNFGVTFMNDGTLGVDAELLEPGDLVDLNDRYAAYQDAVAAASIIRRRYT